MFFVVAGTIVAPTSFTWTKTDGPRTTDPSFGVTIVIWAGLLGRALGVGVPPPAVPPPLPSHAVSTSVAARASATPACRVLTGVPPCVRSLSDGLWEVRGQVLPGRRRGVDEERPPAGRQRHVRAEVPR